MSVRSFHVPATPFTCAWPPSLPSVPTSRATRVTSEANEPSWSTIVFTVLAVRRNSPFSGRPSISRAIVCERSPLATAPMTRATSVVGWTRSADEPIHRIDARRPRPPATGTDARWLIRPSFPTTLLSLSNSPAIRSFRSMTSFRAS